MLPGYKYTIIHDGSYNLETLYLKYLENKELKNENKIKSIFEKNLLLFIEKCYEI